MAASPKDDSSGAGADSPADSTASRAAVTSDQQDLREWAARIAAKLPPLTESQVATVARMAARLDAREQQAPAA